MSSYKAHAALVVLRVSRCVWLLREPLYSAENWAGEKNDVCIVIEEHIHTYSVVLPNGTIGKVGTAACNVVQRYLPSRRRASW